MQLGQMIDFCDKESGSLPVYIYSQLEADWIADRIVEILERESQLIYSNIICQGAMYTMTSSNGNIFRVAGPLRGEFTGHRWISLTKASEVGLWCFLWYAPELTVE